MIRFLVNVLLISCFAIASQAQFMKNHEISFSLGVIEEGFNRINSQDLDFVNYLDTFPDAPDFVVLKFGYKFDFLSKMSADIKLILMDDILPDNFDISTYYNLNNKLAVGLGTYINKVYITGFEQYQLQLLPNYYYVGYNIQQFRSYSWGFYASSVFKLIDNERFKIKTRCDLGMLSFLKNNADFFHKKKLSNEIMQYHYQTNLSFQAFVRPELDISVRVFKIKKTSIGLFLNSNFLYAKRRIKYMRTIEKWTLENSESKECKPPKHNYSLFELNVGLFFRW